MNKTKKTLFLVPSIGGGFMGAAVVMAEIINIKAFQFGHFLIFGAAIGLFVYFIYAGICFATDESNVKHLKLAFLLQVPWFSSPIITYKISAGVELACLLHVSGFNFLYNIGSSFNFSLFNGQSWGIGLNFAALGLYCIASKTTPAR